jgi:hypothetical protein
MLLLSTVSFLHLGFIVSASLAGALDAAFNEEQQKA